MHNKVEIDENVVFCLETDVDGVAVSNRDKHLKTEHDKQK